MRVVRLSNLGVQFFHFTDEKTEAYRGSDDIAKVTALANGRTRTSTKTPIPVLSVVTLVKFS